MLEKDQLGFLREKIVETMPYGFLALSLSGEVLAANPAAIHLFGVEEENLLGKRFVDVFAALPGSEDLLATVEEARREHKGLEKTLIPYSVGEEKKWLRIEVHFFQDEEDLPDVVMTATDVTEMVSLRGALETMKQIEALNKQLEMRNRLLEGTFGRYLSESVVRELLDTPGGLTLGGQKQDLTILMSDLRGFTQISESLPPEDLISMLNHYLGEMTEAIQGMGGTIIEFIGDGILSIFGAPKTYEDHPARAVAAAIDMQARMADVNAWNEQYDYPPLEMGIGIHTGLAILGNIGSLKRAKYGVVGNAVNLAGRIESFTVGGQVLISRDTRRRVDAKLKIVERMEVIPKGVDKPMPVYQVCSIGAPYSLSYPLSGEGLSKLKTPLIVRVSRMEGKKKQKEVFLGQVRARSQKELLLSTREFMEIYDNLCLQIPGEPPFYGKVVRKRLGGWLIHRTSGYGSEE